MKIVELDRSRNDTMSYLKEGVVRSGKKRWAPAPPPRCKVFTCPRAWSLYTTPQMWSQNTSNLLKGSRPQASRAGLCRFSRSRVKGPNLNPSLRRVTWGQHSNAGVCRTGSSRQSHPAAFQATAEGHLGFTRGDTQTVTSMLSEARPRRQFLLLTPAPEVPDHSATHSHTHSQVSQPKAREGYSTNSKILATWYPSRPGAPPSLP